MLRSAGFAVCLAAAWPIGAMAETVVAARTIRSRTILSQSDIVLQDSDATGAFTALDQVIGLEARVVLYQGRPIGLNDVGPAAVIERNQIVTLIFNAGALTISTDARALGRAGVGDRLRVMNLASRNIVFGQVDAFGNVVVANAVRLNTR
jgi:flagellar basal body P-ring formation protein FlgA